MKEEPREDELGVAAAGADHKENVDNEAEETGEEDSCEDGIQLTRTNKLVNTWKHHLLMINNMKISLLLPVMTLMLIRMKMRTETLPRKRYLMARQTPIICVR